MNIDWSKAPEGATHWDLGMNSRVAGWMKLDDGIWYWWPVKDAKCDMKWHSSLNQHLIEMQNFIARPCDWTGEGLPPVGTVCDLKFDHWTDWERHEILCHGKTFMFVRELNSGLDREGSMSMDGIMFRQVRTPEQIAEEARLAELNLMIRAIKDHPGGRHGVDHLTQLKIHEEACINLYDAGWRKQVAQ